MGNDAGLAEPRDDAVGNVAGALRGTARKDQHVADGKRRAHGSFKRFFIVGNSTEKHRVAAVLGNRGGDDRALGVVDRGGTPPPARPPQLVAGGGGAPPRPSPPPA